MYAPLINQWVDYILACLVGGMGIIALLISGFLNPEYNIAHWVFLLFYMMLFLLWIDRSINESGIHILRIITSAIVFFAVFYSFIPKHWVIWIALLLSIGWHLKSSINRSFLTGFSIGFWLLHYLIAFRIDIRYREIISMETFHETVIDWKILIVVAFGIFYYSIFKENDYFEERVEEKQINIRYKYTKIKDERIKEEIKRAKEKLSQTNNRAEKIRLQEYIKKRERMINKN